MARFKIGQRVRVLTSPYTFITPGDTVTIVKHTDFAGCDIYGVCLYPELVGQYESSFSMSGTRLAPLFKRTYHES